MRLIVLVPSESVRPENMSMQRVVILGRGGAGKSTVARRLGEAFGLPVKPTALGDGWRPRSLRCPSGPSLCGRHGSVPRSSVVALSVADPPPGQRKVGLLVVADYLGMAGTTENRSPARRSPNGCGTYISLTKRTRPVSVQARAGMMKKWPTLKHAPDFYC